MSTDERAIVVIFTSFEEYLEFCCPQYSSYSAGLIKELIRPSLLWLLECQWSELYSKRETDNESSL